MRNALKTLALALCVAGLTFALCGGPRAEAQGRAAWDYRVLRLDPKDYRDKLDWQEALRLGGKDGAEAIFYEHVLDTLAVEGWELIQSQQRSPSVTYFYLRKRNG